MAAVIQDRPMRFESGISSRFVEFISAGGLCVFVYAVYVVATSEPSLDWILLGLVTTLVVGRTTIRIPKTDSTVTLDDTFIFISVLLYGVWPSVVLAGVNALLCSLRFPNRKKVAPFNTGADCSGLKPPDPGRVVACPGAISAELGPGKHSKRAQKPQEPDNDLA